MSEKYLIVGATGSIGSNLSEKLCSSGYKVHLVGRDESQIKSLSEKLTSVSLSEILAFFSESSDFSDASCSSSCVSCSSNCDGSTCPVSALSSSSISPLVTSI